VTPINLAQTAMLSLLIWAFPVAVLAIGKDKGPLSLWGVVAFLPMAVLSAASIALSAAGVRS
jgi:hypothetical protein